MEFIKFEIKDLMAIIQINKPQALNALNQQILRELNTAIDKVEKDKSLRCLIITGEGEKAFVAGADIKEINSLNPSTASEFAGFGQKVFMRIENLKIPVIAAVNGFALGGGLELALACDFIIASDNAKLGLPECTLGLIPGFGGTIRLSRKIGSARAKQMTFTGDMISAKEALDFGLVNEVVAQADLIERSIKVAETISKRAPLAISAIKRTIENTYGMDIENAMKVEQSAFAKLFESEDCKEGTMAFIEKRKAQFQGK
jgi:enoyl-CoA hydratase